MRSTASDTTRTLKARTVASSIPARELLQGVNFVPIESLTTMTREPKVKRESAFPDLDLDLFFAFGRHFEEIGEGFSGCLKICDSDANEMEKNRLVLILNMKNLN